MSFTKLEDHPIAGQRVSRFFFFLRTPLCSAKVPPRVEMRLQKFELLHQTINTNSGAVAVVEVSKRTQGYSETFRTAAAK